MPKGKLKVTLKREYLITDVEAMKVARWAIKNMSDTDNSSIRQLCELVYTIKGESFVREIILGAELVPAKDGLVACNGLSESAASPSQTGSEQSATTQPSETPIPAPIQLPEPTPTKQNGKRRL